jgi:hypothetical protein
MGWRCGSCGKVPALQEQSPEFKLHSHQKEKVIQEKNKENYMGIMIKKS